MKTLKRHQNHQVLKTLMFSQFLSLGCVSPVLSLYLQHHLHFDAFLTGLVLSGSTIAAFTTPLLATFIADRLIPSRILLLACNLAAGLANAALVFSQDFGSFFAAFMILTVAQGPVVGLVNTLVFHHLEDGVRQYGPVRLWGSLGWVVAGWTLSLLWMVLPLMFPGTAPGLFQPLMFWFALAGSVATAILSLSLPKSKSPVPSPSAGEAAAQAAEGQTGASPWSALVPREALQAMKSRLFIVLGMLYFGGGLMDRLFYFGAAPYLPHAGFPEGSVMAILTLGQVVEIAFLAVLGTVLAKTGFKKGILFGLVLQILRPLLLAIPGPVTALTGIALHGLIVGFIHMGIIMQLNAHCDLHSRSGINQIYTFLFSGLASLAGNLGGGAILKLAIGPGMDGGPLSGWPVYWLGNAACALAFLVVFLLTYPKGKDPKAS